MATAKIPRKKNAADEAQPPTRVLRRFRLVFNAIKAHFRSVERKAGISGAQVWALSVVRDQPGIGVGQLAPAMDVQQSPATNLLRALIDAELVVSDRGAADRRSVQLSITAKGVRILKKAPGPFAGLLPDALQRLDAATLARLERDLGKLIEELGLDESGASFPLGSDD